MTDRDEFAAAAMTGLLAGPGDKDFSMEYWARHAYGAADAMLRERERNGAVSGRETVTLTDAERDAIEGAIATEHERGAWQWADTLRNLLTRLA